MKTLNDIPTSELARLLGVTMPFISSIKAGRQPMPSQLALSINEHYSIPLWELRPDIYPEHLFKDFQK